MVETEPWRSADPGELSHGRQARQASPPGVLTFARPRSWFCLLVLWQVVCCSGCGGCGGPDVASPAEIEAAKKRRKAKEAEERKEEEASIVERKNQAAKLAQRVEKRGKRTVHPEDKKTTLRRKPDQARPTPPEKARMSARPGNVSEWKRDDYYAARREGDPRLVEAVAHVAEHYRGDAKAARLLANLLKPQTRENGTDGVGPAGGGRRKIGLSARTGGRRLRRDHIQAIVTALGSNGTEFARQTLEQLLRGTLATDDVRTSRQAALKALIAYLTPESEAILLRILTETEESTLPENEDRVSRALRQEILDLAEANASEEFRWTLAQYLVDPAASPERRRRLGEFLLQPSPRNLSAQILFYRDLAAPADTRKTLDKYFVTYSREAIRRLLGCPEESSTASWQRTFRGQAARIREGVSADPELPSRVARLLWSDPFAEAMASRLYQVDALEEQSQIISLAGSIPRDQVRSALHATLERNWQDGPASLDSAGLFDTALTDPGFLVVVKMLLRGERTPRQPGRGRSGQRTSAGRPTGNSPLLTAQREREATEREWLRASADLLLGLCGRLESAALARAAAGDRAEQSDGQVGVSLPIRLHENARVVARYDAVWPESLPQQFPKKSVSPLEIHYARIEEKTRFKKMSGYYRRQLGGAEEHSSTRGVWFELLGTGPAPDRRRSVDVLIARTAGSAPASLNDEERLTIDVLSIEIRDPSASE